MRRDSDKSPFFVESDGRNLGVVCCPFQLLRDYMTKWHNYFVPGKYSRLTEGHLPADKLLGKIMGHDGATAYCGYFDMDHAALKLECWEGKLDADGKRIYTYVRQSDPVPQSTYNPKLSFKGYDKDVARAALGLISFDFDAKDPSDALKDVRNFVEWLGVPDLAVFFSGSKGFHVMAPIGYFSIPEVSKDLPYILRDLATHLKSTYPTLDNTIYNYNRKFRVPFSLHETTKVYKSYLSIENLGQLSIDDMRAAAKERRVVEFVPKPRARIPLPQLTLAIDNSRRATYEIDKSKSGTIEASTKFESFPEKRCIRAMLENTCHTAGRNNAALRIVNDYYRVGRPKARCETDLLAWSKISGLPFSEIEAIISNIYDRGANYNFGCQDEVKAAFCSAKCDIWGKLLPDKRPQAVDSPKSEFKKEQAEKKPKEEDIVHKLLVNMFRCRFDPKTQTYEMGTDGLLLKQERDLFRYCNGYWKLATTEQIDKIKTTIANMHDGHGKFREIESTFKHLMIKCPGVPDGISLYYPPDDKANFRDGTLHLIEDDKGEYSLEFRNHDRLDFITFQIPWKYKECTGEVNEQFIAMFDRIFEDDPDKADKILAFQEMFGAALMPRFPHLFYLYGVSASGKSSIMKILTYLIGSNENISNVQPKDFDGFNLESMAGKLVNISTELKTRAPISEDIVKQIEDHDPIRIRRKNLKDIHAKIPAIHIFGGNALPKSFEEDNHTFDRRWTVVKFNNTHKGAKTRNFASTCFNHNPHGVLAFALEGLRKVVEAKGYFTRFKASQDEVKEWGESDDVVAQFLKDKGSIEDGSAGQLVEALDARIKPKQLWRIFQEWQNDSSTHNEKIGCHAFYARIQNKGFKKIPDDGYYFFRGLGEKSGAAITGAPSDTI